MYLMLIPPPYLTEKMMNKKSRFPEKENGSDENDHPFSFAGMIQIRFGGFALSPGLIQ